MTLSQRPPLAACLSSLLAVSACARSTEEPCSPDRSRAPSVDLVVTSSRNLNPSAEQQSLPVVLRLYILTRRPSPEELEFSKLWTQDEDVFGDALADDHELTVYPDQVLTRALAIPDGATHLLAVAVYRNPGSNDWYRLLSLPAPEDEESCHDEGATCVSLRLERYRVLASKVAAGPCRAPHAQNAQPTPAAHSPRRNADPPAPQHG